MEKSRQKKAPILGVKKKSVVDLTIFLPNAKQLQKHKRFSSEVEDTCKLHSVIYKRVYAERNNNVLYVKKNPQKESKPSEQLYAEQGIPPISIIV